MKQIENEFCRSFCYSRKGSTNKKEWDTFSRQCCDRKKFPVALSSHLQRDKVDLFYLWLDNGQDLKKPPSLISFLLFV